MAAFLYMNLQKFSQSENGQEEWRTDVTVPGARAPLVS
jgi:hypothetical protein